ncbi:DNA mismatch repair protein Mlh3 isoform X2 [Tiliqua scincoides]|uniref:DNA mismatch repair protein Mlh3 isoform X2 n=1 Tax=Tiliqua scincoides TaxID=71010 RepID=UPI0034624947
MIKCLTEEVQASLRSGVAISSLGQCVEELVLNSIDAHATCIAIRVDLETFKIQVVDNGCGMGKEDLNKVGSRYFTSKCFSVEDLENLKCYGFRGEALASIADMATVLELSSKTTKTARTFQKLFHNGKGLEVSETELNRPSAGTTVTVYNLFHQLPVRRKSMDTILEFERVRHKVEALSLMHPSVSFSLRNDASCSMVLQLPKTRDTYSRFSQVYNLGKSQKLREINYKDRGFEICGFISSEGHYNKNIQFLYVNNRLVLKTRLHKLIDFLLRKQSIICKPKSGPMTSSPAHHRSGSELYGIFVINVKCPYNEYDVCFEPAKTLIEFRNWDSLLTCIEEGVKAFLKQEHLFIELCGEDIKEFNENNDFCLGNAVALELSLPQEKGLQESFKRACDNIVDSCEMFTLQSKSVRRKITLAKTSDHTGPSNSIEETDIHPDLTGAEPVHELGSNNVENSQPDKNGFTPHLPKLSILSQQPEVFDHPQIKVTNSKCQEELCGQEKLVVLERDNHSAASFCTMNCDKDANSQKDRVLQKSSPSFETGIDGNEFKCEFIFGKALGKYKAVKEGKGPLRDSNTSEEVAMGQEPLMLCSTGLVTHLMQNQQLQKTTELYHSSNGQRVLGPVSAKDIFEKNMGFSGQAANTGECLRITSGRICTANEQMKSQNVFDQKNEVPSFLAHGSTDFVTSQAKELISVGPSDSVNNIDCAIQRKQMVHFSARSTHCVSTKLSLHPKLGSLDRFKRHYGNIKNIPPITDVEKRNGALVHVKSVENKDLLCSSTCETPTKECVVSNESDCVCLLPLEKSGHSSRESSLSKKVLNVRESPLILADYAAIQKTALPVKVTGTLASKVSRMKGNLKPCLSPELIEQPSEQVQAYSGQKDEGRGELASQNNILLNTSQIAQSSPEEIGSESHSFSSEEPGQPTKNSGTRVEDGEDTVSHFFIDTDGEYIVSQDRSLPLSSAGVCSESTRENIGIVDGYSKQAVKNDDLTCVSSPHCGNMEGAAGNAGTTENELLHPSEWLLQFDGSLGRTVYINKMTGLSSYSAPPSEEPHAVCTKDITTVAVNVVTENDTQGESLQSLFAEWDNPLFARYPEVAVDVSSEQADSLAVKIHNILYPYRFTKEMIDSVKVLNQVDNKFIACLINTGENANRDKDGNLLVLVDQHAAHERVRLEQLITDSYEKHPEASGKKKLLSSTVCPPLEIEVTEEQRRLLWCYHKKLEDLGLEISFPENNPSQILVGKLPLCFVEREANELRRGRQTVAKSIVQEFIREQVELLQTTGGARGTLPLTILKVLASQACHGAIKFNDSLTLEDSCHLMEALSCCQLPFQCAHGRPSMLPLADIEHLQQENQPKPNLVKLRRMAKAWQLFGKEKDSNVTE